MSSEKHLKQFCIIDIKREFCRNNTMRSKSGFSLVEILIAAAILVIASYLIGTFVFTTKTIGKKARSSSECENSIKSVLDVISKFGVRDNIVEEIFIPTSTTNRKPSVRPPNSPTGSEYYTLELIGLGPLPRINNSQQIVSSTTILQSILNNNPNYCSNNEESFGVDVTASLKLFSDVLPSLLKRQLFLKIIPFSIDTNKELPCPNTAIGAVPVGIKMQASINDVKNEGINLLHDESDPLKWVRIGYKAVASLSYVDQNEVEYFCQAEASFQHQRDSSVPNNATSEVTAILAALNGAAGFSGTPVNPLGNTSCSGTSGYNDIILKIQFSNLEPGSVLICKGTVSRPRELSVSGDWYACDQMKFPNINHTTLADWSNNTLSLRFNDLSDDYQYTVTWRAVDTAGNGYAENSASFIIDATGPNLEEIREITNPLFLGGPENSVNPARGASPITHLSGASSVAWAVPKLQCLSGSVKFEAIYSNDWTDFPENRNDPCFCSYQKTGSARVNLTPERNCV